MLQLNALIAEAYMFEVYVKIADNNFKIMEKIRKIEKIKRYSDSEVETGYRQ